LQLYVVGDCRDDCCFGAGHGNDDDNSNDADSGSPEDDGIGLPLDGGIGLHLDGGGLPGELNQFR